MLPESLLGLSNGPNMQSMGESTGEKENRHQAEELPESHRHLLVCVWDQILGSKCHPYASKHDQRHFRGIRHGIKDMFCLLSVFLCMFLEHGGHSDVKTTWGCPCASPLVMWRHAFQVTHLCKGTSNHSFTPQRSSPWLLEEDGLGTGIGIPKMCPEGAQQYPPGLRQPCVLTDILCGFKTV